MGVPGFYKMLMEANKKKSTCENKPTNLVLQAPETQTTHLFVDANCMMHPECFKVLSEYPNSEPIALEKKMLSQITDYMDYIVDTVGPTKMLFISVDGPAPMAKMAQQRLRRFKSVRDKLDMDKLKKKHDLPPGNKWTNTNITPGTQFMLKITDSMNNYIASRLPEWRDRTGNPDFKVIFSSGNTPGEGEHKILQYIRKNINETDDSTLAIYGLDADLFFLALSTELPKIYLVRELLQFDQGSATTDSKSTFGYCSIDILKENIIQMYGNKCQEFKQYIGESFDEHNKNHATLIRDFIFLCYLLGNDFIPHIPSLDIYNGGLEKALQTYGEISVLHLKNGQVSPETIESLPNPPDSDNTLPPQVPSPVPSPVSSHTLSVELNPLVTKVQKVTARSKTDYDINLDFFTEILAGLSKTEDADLKHITKKSRKRRYAPNGNTPYETERWKQENLCFWIQDDVKYDKGSPAQYKSRYYNKYFKQFGVQDKRPLICQHYLNGLRWIANYYFSTLPSWDWFYPFYHAPFVSDLHYFLSNDKARDTVFNHDSRPCRPITQLAMVIPKESAFLLPEPHARLLTSVNSPLKSLYVGPYDYDVDILHKSKNWQGIPMLPEMQPGKVISAISQMERIEINRMSIENKKIYDRLNKIMSEYVLDVR